MSLASLSLVLGLLSPPWIPHRSLPTMHPIPRFKFFGF